MADCDTPIHILENPIACAAQIPGKAAGGIAGGALEDLAGKMFEALGKVLTLLMTFWRGLPGPDLNSSGSTVHTINGYTTTLTAFALIIGTMVAGVRLALQARADEEGKIALKGILLTVIIAGFGGGLMTLITVGFDAMGNSILDGALNGTNVQQRIGDFVGGTNSIPVIGAGLAFLLYLLATLASLGQAAFMVMRNPIMILLTGVWPVFAASAITRQGSEWFRKITAWLMSFAMYKFVAALVYATAFSLIGNGTSAGNIVSGAVLLILAVFALPALMRLLTPLAAAIPGGAGVTGGVLGGIAASGAVAAMSGGAGLAVAGAGAVGSVSPASAAATATGAAASAPAASGGGAGLEAGSQAVSKAIGGAKASMADAATHHDDKEGAAV